MIEIKMLAESFFTLLALGVGIFTPIANTKDTGAGLFKLMTSVVFCSLIISFCLHLTYGKFYDQQSIGFEIALVCCVFSYFLHRDEKSIPMWIIYVIQNLSLLYIMALFHNQNMHNYLFALSSAGLLGSVTYAMLLGHWYLVTPKLSEKPLMVACYVIFAFLVVKIGLSTHEVIENHHYFESGSRRGAGYMFNWILLCFRLGWGYLVIFTMNIFNYKLIKMRSTQSATGILYAMTFFVLIGELTSNYIYLKYGLKI